MQPKNKVNRLEVLASLPVTGMRHETDVPSSQFQFKQNELDTLVCSQHMGLHSSGRALQR